MLHEVSQIGCHHRRFVRVLRAIHARVLVADRRIASADLARAHHLSLVSRVLLAHVHLVIGLVAVLLSVMVRLAGLVEDLDPVLHLVFGWELVVALVRRLWLLLVRLLLVERLVVLRRLGASAGARVDSGYLLELLIWRVSVEAIFLSEALSAADSVIEVRAI